MPDHVLDNLDREFPDFAAKLRARKDADVEYIEPPATEHELAELESSLGIALPNSYKQFLRCARGFRIFGGSIQFGTQHPFFHHFQPYEQLAPQQQQVVQRSQLVPSTIISHPKIIEKRLKRRGAEVAELFDSSLRTLRLRVSDFYADAPDSISGGSRL